LLYQNFGDGADTLHPQILSELAVPATLLFFSDGSINLALTENTAA